MSDRSVRILCVGMADVYRSPMFAAVLRARLDKTRPGHNVLVESAGVLESARRRLASIGWFMVQDKTGVSLAGHEGRFAGDLDLASYDKLLCMDGLSVDEVLERGAPRRSVHLVNQLYRGIMPPSKEVSPREYLECFQTICQAVERLPEAS